MEQVSAYQRRFLEELSVEKIADEVALCMRDLIEADRYLLLAREVGGDEVRVVKDMGHLGALIESVRFPLKESPLLRLVFEKEQILNRGLQIGESLLHGVPPGADVRGPMGALAVPVPTDKGVELCLVVASAQRKKVSDHHQQLLAAIGRAAGFALSRARWYQEKADLASRDGLTGALNHRAFKERLGEELLRAQRYEQKFALMMVDIDFFKRINDSYGHPRGDQVLRTVAGILAENVRAGVDLVARYGGEEFVLLLSDTDSAGAKETAERIRKALESQEFESGSTRFRATASIGGAIFPEDGKRGQDILERADKALYRAKETGRNKVVLYH
jgi:diguanylate cyclase (GGDEF)-like protein